MADPTSCTGSTTPDTVVLAVVRRQRLAPLQALLRRLQPDALVLTASDTMGAAARLAFGGIGVLVLDLGLDREWPQARIHLLARFAPSAKLVVLADALERDVGSGVEVHAWDNAEAVLKTTMARTANRCRGHAQACVEVAR